MGVGCSVFDRTLKLLYPTASSTSAGEEYFLWPNLAPWFAAGSRVGQTIWSRRIRQSPDVTFHDTSPLMCHANAARARELLEKGNGLEHNRLPLKLIQAAFRGKVTFSQVHERKSDATGIVFLFLYLSNLYLLLGCFFRH